ncbi:MAG TPA: glycosyltransferase family 4 protein, partial [Patescibacteria group bacterium]
AMKIFISRITDRISGAEIYNLNLLKGLRKYKDIEVIFSTDNKELNIEVKKMGINSVLVRTGISEIATKKKLLTNIPRFYTYFKIYFQLFQKFNDVEIFIFHSMTEKLFLSFFLISKKKKVVWVEHGPIFKANWFYLIKLFYKLLSLIVTKIIVVSEDSRLDLISHGISERKVVVIPPGVDTAYFYPSTLQQKEIIKDKLTFNNKFVIGYVGTMTREKGLKEFIDLAVFLTKKKYDVRFLFVGDGPDLEWAMVKINKYRLKKKVFFTGYQNDVRNFYQAMDIFFFPTHHLEGISLALLEASAMGLLIVASDKGGNREIVTSKTGFLYKSASSKFIGNFISKAIENKELFVTTKKNARKLVEKKYTIDITTKTFYNFLENL